MDMATAIIVLGIIVSISAVVLHNIAVSQVENLPSGIIANETVSPVVAGDPLSFQWVKGIEQCYNGTYTGATKIATAAYTGNYTLSVNSDSGVGSLTNKTVTSVVNPIQCTYSIYNISDMRYDLPSHAETGLGEYGNWMKILVIVAIASVILALIFKSFGNLGGRGMGSEGSSSSDIGGEY